MRARANSRLILGLSLLLAVGVFLADVVLTPSAILPGVVWGIPLVIAALSLSPRLVATMVVVDLALEILAGQLHDAAAGPWLADVLGVAVMGFLAVALATRIEREVAQGEEARAERTFASALLDTVGALVVVLDREGRIVRFNHACQELTGYTLDEVKGKTVWDLLLPPEEMEPTRAVFADLRAGHFPRQFENYWLTKDGRRRLVTWSDTALLGGRGEVEHVIATGIDVTERRQARAERERLVAELTFERDRLHTTIESIADVILVCDREGTITISNSAARALFGEDLAERERTLAGYADALKIRTGPNGLPVPLSDLAFARALTGEVTHDRAELATNPKTGRHLDLLISAAPLRDAEGEIVGAVEVARDVSALSVLEHEKDEFIAVAAHELRTPVTIIKSFAQALLRRSPQLDPAQRRMLDSIDRGCNRIDRIVRDLLDISRLQGGQLELLRERLDLAALVEEVVERMALTSAKHHLRVTSAGPVIVRGDRDRLEQVLAVLLDNAIRYSPRGGDVDVTVTVGSGEVVVEVRDQGVGIPAEKQGRLFERFYRAHTGTPYDYGGMGVGLYISKEIIARHGGRIWVESEEGKGTILRLSLPLYEGIR